MRLVRRSFRRRWSATHPLVHVTSGAGRPLSGGVTLATGLHRPRTMQASVPLDKPVMADGGLVWAGMDPSDPGTFVRPWNPQPGMISYLNDYGVQDQGRTDMGGVWSNPAGTDAQAGARPRRRPR